MSPTAEIAGLMFSLLFSFVLTFNGVLQPFRLFGWWRWMYRLPPSTYLIKALLGQGAFMSSILDYICSDKELVTVQPLTGVTCGDFMASYISSRGGYPTNPDASTACRFFSSRTTDEWMGPTFNIFYQHHWRDFGLCCVYIIFNVSFFCFVLLFFWMNCSSFGYLF
ncbi:hypothetical protein BYT27DRAFT_7276122 [Phlegmacium glaucopus]|nr:hypothetical protein BYT27DRAFT_7276122 [Phlegmacium glaucopus]